MNVTATLVPISFVVVDANHTILANLLLNTIAASYPDRSII